MKTEYYQLLTKHNLCDTLKEIPGLSYTKKISIIENLLDTFVPKVVNLALVEYRTNYISLNRINILKLKNMLIYFARKNDGRVKATV